MSDATPGSLTTIEVSNNGTTWQILDNADTVENNRTREKLDATSFGDSAFRRVLGLKDSDISISGNWLPGSAGQTLLDDAFTAGTDVHVRVLLDGTNGYKTICKCGDFNTSSAVADKVTYSAQLVGNDPAGWTRVP